MDIIKYFNEQVLNANINILENQDHQLEQSKKTEDLMQAIYGKLDNKEKLKAKSLQILNNYIRLREKVKLCKRQVPCYHKKLVDK